ncbi:MAG: MaoC family dehydratase N-terminal domain-containing protein [Chloroflexi bacterium]|nr:MaoC family dehydratase N-terminal domain-containing protein [Chloroflexota bacterium]
MDTFPVHIGDEVTFSKTVSESDVYLFAGITGDLSPNHVNEEFMQRTRYGRRIAHGALLVGYMSNCSTAICARANTPNETPVSLGYDRIRFIAPVFIGDTITVTYRVAEIDAAKRESKADVRVTARGELCAVATHILRWVGNG